MNQTKLRQYYICLLLAGITLAGFWPVGRLGFTIYDDQEYVVKNPHVQTGFTADSIRWAFTTSDTGNWHPVTWLSHILDCQLFGLKAAGPHWVNLGLHTASVVLLFLVLCRMTGATWRSALVAALFAVHPLRVESVAWISERKDVLSVFFMMLTLGAWSRYADEAKVQSPKSKVQDDVKSKAQSPRSKVFYGLSLFFFALGLMSKPMLVTLPFILLLLDFWPLERFPISDFRFPILKRLVLEKWPFFLLVAASCVVTFLAQSAGGSVSSLTGMPLEWRVENSLAAYAAYLGKIFWPENLAVLYPLRQIPDWEVISCAALLAGLSGFCLWRARRQPWLLVGWGWFLIMLVPVIGLVQVGKQSMADRYTYLPSIGILIMLVWSLTEIAAKSKPRQIIITLIAAGLVLACLPATRRQLNFWQNDVKLFTHAIEVTPKDNCQGYLVLGNALVEAGKLDDAVRNYQTSLQIDPDELIHLEQAHYNLGCVLFQLKQYPAAEDQYRAALVQNDNNAEAHGGLGNSLSAQKKNAEAAAEYANALRLKPDDTTIRKALTLAMLKAESEKALTNYYQALKIKPTADAHIQIAAIQTIQGNYQDAVEHYAAALQLQPDAPDTLNNLAWLLVACPEASIRNGTQAVKYAERACELTHYGLTRAVGTLAAAYAEAGRFDEAIATAQKACALAEKNGEKELQQKNEELLKLYRAHKAFHEAGGPQ